MDYSVMQSSELEGTHRDVVDIDLDNVEQDDALRMMYTTGGITVNMETNLALNSTSEDSQGPPSGKDFAIQTKNDFLRVSIERENQGESLRLYRCRSPFRGASSRSNLADVTSPTTSSGSPEIRTPSDDDYRESEEWCEELKFDVNNAVMGSSRAEHANPDPAGDEKSNPGDDGYFSPPRMAQHPNTVRVSAGMTSEISSHSCEVDLRTLLPEHCHHDYPTTFDVIKDLHERSSVHSLSDILDDYPEDERRQRHISDRHSDHDSDDEIEGHHKSMFASHKLAITGVGLYSVLLECIGTPKWLNAGLTVGAAALIAYDGAKKNKKAKKIPKILEKIKGPWTEEDEMKNSRGSQKRRNKKGNNGIVVSALVEKFQNLWF
ncbi:uncharacterized protein LOC120347124 [Styela clava]